MVRISQESEVDALQPSESDNAAVQFPLPHPGSWPLPAKALVTSIVVMMSLGLLFAGGQIIVHDIIPTFFSDQPAMSSGHDQMEAPASERGDLFGGSMVKVEKPPFYKSDEFIFALKFTHIHIFGMSAIFILMGAIVFYLHLSPRIRTWLIVLPFIGVIADLTAVWLKIFIHPFFFWLHIPGGVLFGIVFALDTIIILKQLWAARTQIEIPPFMTREGVAGVSSTEKSPLRP